MTALVDRSSAPPDEALVTAAANGDRDAFARLYDSYAQRVYNLVYRSARDAHLAEDLCQEVWVKVYQQLDRLREPAAFSTWLYRIASRICVDRARKRASMPAEAPVVEELPAARSDDPEDRAVQHERERLAWEALSAIPPRQHVALYLREMEGRNYREIANIMGTSQGAIETLLFRARRGFADAYERLEGAFGERCGQAQRSMAVLLDGEATPVQRRAIAAHAEQCQDCRSDLSRMQRASAAYGVLPVLPVPALLGDRIFDAIAGASAAGGAGAFGGSSAVKLLAAATAKAKLVATTALVTGGLTAATIVASHDAVPADGAPGTIASAAVGVDGADGNSDGVGAGLAPSGSGVTADEAALDGQATIALIVATLLQRLDAYEQAAFVGTTIERLRDRLDGGFAALNVELPDIGETGPGLVDDVLDTAEPIVDDATDAIDADGDVGVGDVGLGDGPDAGALPVAPTATVEHDLSSDDLPGPDLPSDDVPDPDLSTDGVPEPDVTPELPQLP